MRLSAVFPTRRGGYWGVDPGGAEFDMLAIRNGDVGTTGDLRWTSLPTRGFTRREAEKARLRQGDIVLTTSGNCGNVATIRSEPETPAIATNFVRILRVDPTLTDSRYIFHFLRSQQFKVAINPFVRGATIKNLSVEAAFDAIEVFHPTIQEQRRIAAILDHADALRAKRRQVLAHLDSLTHSIFHDMFGVPMVMGHWPMRRLGDISRIIRGASPRPAGDPRYFGGGIPWLKISDITGEKGAIVSNIRQGVTDAGRAKSVLLPKMTLVLTNSATVGIPKIIEPETCIHDGFLAFLDLDPSVDKRWLWSALSLSRDRLVALAPEGTQKNLNGPIVKGVRIGIPPYELQQRFVAHLESIETSRQAASGISTANDKLLASLQSRAFRGEL